MVGQHHRFGAGSLLISIDCEVLRFISNIAKQDQVSRSQKLPEIKKLKILQPCQRWTKLLECSIIDEIITVEPSIFQTLRSRT